MSLGIIRLEPDGRAVRGNRLVELSRQTKRMAEIVICVSVLGLQPGRLAKTGQRFVRPSQRRQDVAQVELSPEMVGLEAYCFAQLRDCLLQFFLQAECG